MSPRHLLSYLIAGLAFVVGQAADQGPEPQGKKYALVVSVSRHGRPELRHLAFTDQDANVLATALCRAGYNRVLVLSDQESAERVDLVWSPTADNLRTHLDQLVADLRPEDTFVFAFFGHAVQFKNDPDC